MSFPIPLGGALAALLPLALCAVPSQDPRPGPTPPADAPEVVQLFHALCASCHGETGDGKGWAELDRPARSFQDGGFSFGNTPEAIFRTITHGIPGTPMPAHDTAATEAQRRALAAYVISLGPPDAFGEAPDTELIVGDAPRIARGLLPPIAEGLEPTPRGLLLGTVEGLSFQYRADDVRLLGVRAGRFCDRTDWLGRGGSPLVPLGQVVLLNDGGDPGPTWALVEDGQRLPLRARLRATGVGDGSPGLTYELAQPDGGVLARVSERVAARSSAMGAGAARRLRIEAGAAPVALDLSLAAGEVSAEEREVLHSIAGAPTSRPRHGCCVRQADGRYRWITVEALSPDWRAFQGAGLELDAGRRFRSWVFARLDAGGVLELEVREFLSTEWSDALAAAMEEECR